MENLDDTTKENAPKIPEGENAPKLELPTFKRSNISGYVEDQVDGWAKDVVEVVNILAEDRHNLKIQVDSLKEVVESLSQNQSGEPTVVADPNLVEDLESTKQANSSLLTEIESLKHELSDVVTKLESLESQDVVPKADYELLKQTLESLNLEEQIEAHTEEYKLEIDKLKEENRKLQKYSYFEEDYNVAIADMSDPATATASLLKKATVLAAEYFEAIMIEADAEKDALMQKVEEEAATVELATKELEKELLDLVNERDLIVKEIADFREDMKAETEAAKNTKIYELRQQITETEIELTALSRTLEASRSDYATMIERLAQFYQQKADEIFQFPQRIEEEIAKAREEKEQQLAMEAAAASDRFLAPEPVTTKAEEPKKKRRRWFSKGK